MDKLNIQIWNERWRLARLQREDFIRAGLTAIAIGLVFVLFHLQGSTTDTGTYGRSALVWMVSYWNDTAAFGGGDYSHGWLIPFVSLALVWLNRHALVAAPKSVSRTGLALVVAALLLHWLGAKAQQTRLSLFGLVLLMWAIPFYFYGWKTAKILLFPVSYLIFCIPLNFLDSMTFPLRMLSTVISTGIANGLGLPMTRSGSAIYSQSSDFNVDVADPCSGIRSILAMTALTAVYAYLTQRTLAKKWVLFLASIPLAIVGNIARITTVLIVGEAFGPRIATGIYHDYSGYIFFSVAIVLMVAIGHVMALNFAEVRHRWKYALLSPT